MSFIFTVVDVISAKVSEFDPFKPNIFEAWQMLYIQSQWIDFENLIGVWKLKKFSMICIEIDF